ncbi:MAG: GAF and ANTAR domain-containing protein [Glaciihabitans sp.]
METDTREGRLAAAFVTLADTLVVDYDVVELLQRLVDTCADLLGASAVGLLLTAAGGDLEVVAVTNDESRLVTLIRTHSASGPTGQALATGRPVSVSDISAMGGDMAPFRDEATSLGFGAMDAFPLRLRGSVIGVLTLLRTESRQLTPEDTSVAQGLADIATIGILHERALRESDVVQKQLQHALGSRVVIEQAKGVIAQTRGVEMVEAFRLLREYARAHNRGLREVAERVVSHELRF